MARPRVTIKDVARLAGVSIGSVSNALNDAPGVGDETRKRILATVRNLGYQPNRAAQATRTGRTRTLAFVTPDLRNPFYPQLASAIANAARRAGYALMLIDTGDGQDELQCLEQVARFGIDGILWCPATPQDIMARSEVTQPAVVIDHWLPGRDSIAANYRMSGKLIADHVLAGGYQSIGLISGPQDLTVARARRDHLLAFVNGRVPVIWEVFHPFGQRLNDQALEAVRSASADIIVCSDDMIAIGAMQAVLGAGLSVPDQVAIIGHDDIGLASTLQPGLTTIRQPLDGIGHEAVAILLDRIDRPNRPARDVALDVSLVIRDSTRKIASD